MNQDLLHSIMRLLEMTKDEYSITTSDDTIARILIELDVVQESEQTWRLNRSDRQDLIFKAVSLGAEIEDVVKKLTWKEFEGFVANILTENGFKCVESFRRRGNKTIQGMEIDVIGIRGRNIVSIDAKMWGIRSGKASALRTAAEKQKARTKELTGMLAKLATKIPALDSGKYNLVSIVATWLVEEVQFHDGVAIVPAFKLNSFILDIDKYSDLLVSFSGNLE